MATFLLGQTVPLAYAVTDDTGEAVSPATATLTVTKPDGTVVTPSITEDPAVVGLFEIDYAPTIPGPHSAVFVTTDPAGAQADSFLVASGNTYPVSITELRSYLGDVSALDETLAEALAAEYAAQAARCRIGLYTADLAEALKRRVARNLAARAVPVAQFTSFEGGGTSARVPMTDPEIARLEGPYRRRKVG